MSRETDKPTRDRQETDGWADKTMKWYMISGVLSRTDHRPWWLLAGNAQKESTYN